MFLQTKQPTSRSRCHQAVITLRFAIETGWLKEHAWKAILASVTKRYQDTSARN
jgi:hypothetical protein